MDMRLLVVAIPVSDVDVAIEFYRDKVGFALDHDVSPGNGMRVVQVTPPGSPTSVVFGVGMPLGEPGTCRAPQLSVDDLDAVRADLVSRGVEVGEVVQMGPAGTPGSRYAWFSDPDGNSWTLQELPLQS
ncbi:VOC family protein [Jatrophihabitans sp. YIM 134969]